MGADYATFLERKRLVWRNAGVEVDPGDVSPVLFEFQRDLVRWAVRKGRCAIFADTGLGKTAMQVEWARLTGEPTLIIAPLSVAKQTEGEARKLFGDDVDIGLSRDGSQVARITVTNYEQAHKFDAGQFGAVVLDESSILKSVDGKTKARLIKQWQDTPLRLCCTATPAPNDISEIANHAEFLGIMTRAEMLSSFFIHDSSSSAHNGWRLKGHAADKFYAWLASWGMAVRKPSDLGYSDDGYDLPPLEIQPEFVSTDWKPNGELFFTELRGIQDRIAVRKATVEGRVDRVATLVNGSTDQWLVWCGMNDESSRCADLIEGAVEVKGADSHEAKAEAIEGFLSGAHRVLVTKVSIAGFGMNFQHCHRMVFVGLGDSWESYYQAIRRCYRFGQTKPVDVRIVLSDPEREIYANVMRKEREAKSMARELVKHVAKYEQAEIRGEGSRDEYTTDDEFGDSWHLMLGDSCERIGEVDDDSVGMAVFSPPFGSLYTYSPTERDLGNSKSDEEFFAHFGVIIRELRRVLMPGRLVCCHVQQIPTTKQYDGHVGVKDFRGDVIRAFVGDDWIYHGEVCIDKDPQAQAIRTKAKGLLFVTKNKDSSWSRPAFADYILLFRKPGENPEQVKTDVTNEEWIEYAHPVWYGIKESETLQAAKGRDGKDEKHICPLQLETIRRCVRLWSNKGDLVLSPFAGIGSEGFVSIQEGRQFVGCELKPSYFRAAVANLRNAERNSSKTGDMLALMEAKQ